MLTTSSLFQAFFLVFSGFTIISTLFIIFLPNTVHAIFFLIFAFINAAGLLFLINMEFLGLVFLIVYVGAIAVLFLFVVMMLSIKVRTYSFKQFFFTLPLGGIIGLFLFIVFIKALLNNDPQILPIEISIVEYQNFLKYQENNSHSLIQYFYILHKDSINLILLKHHDIFKVELLGSNIENIAKILYSYFGILFLISGLILFIAMLGAIVLTIEHKKTVLRQHLYNQASRNIHNAIFKVKPLE